MPITRNHTAGETVSQGNPLEERTPKRRTSFLSLKLSHLHFADNSSGSSTPGSHHLHLPTFSLTTPEGENGTGNSGRRFHFGLRRHSNTTLNRTESMVSLCFRSLTGFVLDDNLPGLQAFLENKQVQVDDRDENGCSALMVAAAKGRAGFIRELLAHGADPGAQDLDGWSALLCAARDGHSDICMALLEHGADIEHRDMGGWTALMWAAYKGHADTVVLLLDRGADSNAHGNFHISSLLWASGRGHLRIVAELVARGAKVNVGDKYGTTALVWACRKGYTDIVECLLKVGANVDTAGMYSWTALLVATQGNHVDVVNLLLEHRPNVNALDKDGCTALTIACKEGFYDITTALLNAGAYINIQDRMGDTNLIHAVKGGHRGIVEALLKKYADVDICGKDKKTALYTAVEKGNLTIVRLLLGANPDLEISTKDGDTPLLRAVRSRNADIVQLLLDKKAKVSATDKKGDTVLHIAMRARSKAIVEILLRNPKHSQLLYRPNQQGETAYNIDLNHQKQILGQVFGARRLNTNEDNENMLGYDLYSSALADMLSEPSLSMPITVGLYAKWGSGKSFLLNKLREEMKNFARQWVDPVFHFSSLLFLVVVHLAVISGTVVGVALLNWMTGVITGATVLVVTYVLLAVVYFLNHRYDWDWPYSFTVNLTRKLNALRLILQITFCHPPQPIATDSMTAQPIRFYFTDQTRVSSTTGGENSVVQMLGSLYDAIENNYGTLPTRLYRAFKPKPVKSSSSWRLRRLCCLPYAVVFELCIVCLLVGICTLTIYLVRQARSNVSVPVQSVLNISVLPTSQINDALEEVTDVTMHVVLITVALLLGVTCVANLYTWGRVFVALVFSQRRHLQRAISRLDTLKSEGFQQALTHEVALMKDMVKCMDALSAQQTRLVVIVDGLDSCEQDKVLLVLDAVHMLFSEANSPFIVILAIDPHVISKAVELNSRRLFTESNIGGHDYLRNLVHLPFFLQNSGLRKVKVAQQTAQGQHRKPGAMSSGWTEGDEPLGFGGGSNVLVRSLSNRRLSSESALMSSCEKLKPPAPRKGSRKLKMSDSIASSIGSNLNIVVGAHDLTKMLLTDDYFSDVNPRSMRRLMNVVYVTGRLLKAFQIDFNWYHLASWINITEQWPYRTSWIILHYDLYEEQLEDNTSLKTLYDKVRPRIPTLKEAEPLLELDRDEKKYDIFLTFHRNSLLVSDMKIFLPFTINLDPYIKKVIKEEYQNVDDEHGFGGSVKSTPLAQWAGSPAEWNLTSKPVITQRRQRHQFRPTPPTLPLYPQHSNVMAWGPQPNWPIESNQSLLATAPYAAPQYALSAVTNIPAEVLDTKLSMLTVTGVCQLFERIDDLSQNALSQYTSIIKSNNINGRVLLHCDLDELKKILKMNFGDWEMFRVLIVSLREHELTSVCRQDEGKGVRFSDSTPRERKSSNPKSHTSERESKVTTDTSAAKARSSNKQSIMEKQVTLEDQMICGALQTLNEEACEDVLEENVEPALVDVTDIPQTTLIPPSPDQLPQQLPDSSSGYRSRTSSTGGETDFVILQSSPFQKFHWQPVMSISSTRDSSHSENSSVCSTPRARRKKDLSVFIQEPRKSTDSGNSMIDLKAMNENSMKGTPATIQITKNTDNIHSSMYGQNGKHSSVNRAGSHLTDSNTLPGKNSLQENLQRTYSVKNITSQSVSKASKTHRQRPSSLLVDQSASSSRHICVRSKSVDDNSNKNKHSVLSCVKMKFGDTLTPTSSLEKLSKLKEKLLNASTDSRELPNSNLDSDDESTPLVSDISTPSISLGHGSPPQHFHNGAFSPQSNSNSNQSQLSPASAIESSPSQQFSSPEAEHKNDTNLTDSTDFSPVSPIQVHSTGGNTVSINDSSFIGYLSPPVARERNYSATSSDLSLSNYLEPSSRFYQLTSISHTDSMASISSINSDNSRRRSTSNASNLSRQNAMDSEEHV